MYIYVNEFKYIYLNSVTYFHKPIHIISATRYIILFYVQKCTPYRQTKQIKVVSSILMAR